MKDVLTQQELAAYLHVGLSTLERWRMKGTGPAYIKIGRRRVGYLRTTVQAWLEANEHQSSKEYVRDHQANN